MTGIDAGGLCRHVGLAGVPVGYQQSPNSSTHEQMKGRTQRGKKKKDTRRERTKSTALLTDKAVVGSSHQEMGILGTVLKAQQR